MWHQIIQIVLLQSLYGFFGETVLTKCADGDGIVTAQELSCVIGEIGRCAT